jgi:hypothetical protein
MRRDTMYDLQNDPYIDEGGDIEEGLSNQPITDSNDE